MSLVKAGTFGHCHARLALQDHCHLTCAYRAMGCAQTFLFTNITTAQREANKASLRNCCGCRTLVQQRSVSAPCMLSFPWPDSHQPDLCQRMQASSSSFYAHGCSGGLMHSSLGLDEFAESRLHKLALLLS
jgi:hypothetical protein